MIFSRRVFDDFFEIGINPKTDLRCLLAFLRHGLPILNLLYRDEF